MKLLLFVTTLSFASFAQEPAAEGPPDKLGASVLQIDDLGEPTGVAWAKDGALLVCESLSHRVRAFDASGAELRVFGEDVLLDPRDVDLAASGEVVVSDAGLHAILVFDAQGKELRRIGALGRKPGELDSPQGIDVTGTTIAVADSRNDRVQIFGLDGKFLGEFGGPGAGEGRFHRPADVVAAPDGGWFVADMFHHRVQCFSSERKFVRAFGSPGPNPGQFGGPTGLDFSGGVVHVVDRDNSRVQIFQPDGELIDWYGIHALRPREGKGKLHYPLRVSLDASGRRAAIVEPVENRVQVLGPVDPDTPELPPLPSLPPSHYGGPIDAEGPLFAVTEPSIPRINLYRMHQGEPVEITNFGTYGVGVGQLQWPSDVAIDLAARRIHVADTGSGRILSYEFRFEAGEELGFDPERARFVEQLDLAQVPWARDGEGKPVSIEPQGLWRDGEGGLCIADPRNRAVWRLDRDWKSGVRVDLPATCVEVADGCAGPAPSAGSKAPREQFVIDRLGGRVFELGSGKPVAEGLARPAGALVTTAGAIYVADEGGNALLRVGPKPLELARGPGLGPKQLSRPRGLAELAGGRVVVIDWGNHRGSIFAPSGEFLRAFGSQLFIRPTFTSQAEKSAEPESKIPASPAARAALAVDGTKPWHKANRCASANYAVHWLPTPNPIVERQTFTLEVWVTPATEPNTLAEGLFLKLDAAMPEHGHGINVVPVTTVIDPGHFRVEGTRLHMPGRWEMYFDLERDGHAERAQVTMELD